MSAPIDTRQQLQPQPLTIPQDFGGLTLKQHSFIDHYLQTGNATDATIKAGYTNDRDSAAQIGSRLLRNVKIQQEIKRRLGIAVASSEEVLETLTKHARGDLTDVLTQTGEFDFKLAKRKRLLKKLKIKKRYEKDADGNLQPVIEQEFEIHDPQAALEKLGRFHKLFTEKIETDLDQSSVERLAESIISGLFAAAQARQEQVNQSHLLAPESEPQ